MMTVLERCERNFDSASGSKCEGNVNERGWAGESVRRSKKVRVKVMTIC